MKSQCSPLRQWPNRVLAVLVSLACLGLGAGAQEQPRVWITPKGPEAGALTLHWQSDIASDSSLSVGKAVGDLSPVPVSSGDGIFRAELTGRDPEQGWRYQIGGREVRELRGWRGETLRIVVVGDWHGNARPGAEAILRDDPHLLVTAGDNVTSLHQKGKEGLKAYAALVDSAPELFARVPVLPALGNHDNEGRPRGSAPPAEPVYDVSAKVFRTFFGLPEDGWRRQFRIPDHNLSLLLLDLHHTTDFGTTWQSGHAFEADSEQVRWLRDIAPSDRGSFRIFVYNEQNARVRGLAKGAFKDVFLNGEGAAITGFGGYTERAEFEGFPFYNTHIHGGGTDYADPHRAFATAAGAYLLLTQRSGDPAVRIEVKNHDGEVLDTREISRKPDGAR